MIEGGGDVRTADVELERFDQYAAQMTVNGRRYRLLTDTHGPISIVDVGGSPIASAATRAASCAPCPGTGDRHRCRWATRSTPATRFSCWRA